MTGTVFGEPVAPAVVAVTVTVAVYVPAARPLMMGATESVAGAVALAGVTVSQAASSEAVTSSVPLPVLVTETFCAAGLEPPTVALKVRLDGGPTAPEAPAGRRSASPGSSSASRSRRRRRR